MANHTDGSCASSPLDRHYSTIGIEDVFLNPPPGELLPKSYLGAKASSSDRDACFRTWEIVGAIKSIPEDFVVREITSQKRSPKLPEDFELVADLGASIEMAAASRPSIKKGESTSSEKPIGNPHQESLEDDSDEPCDDGTCVGKPASQSTDKKGNENEAGTGAATTQVDSSPSKTPAEIVQGILVKSFGLKKGNGIMDQIRELQEKALELLQSRATGGEASNHDGTIDAVWIPPLPSETRLTSHKGDRGRLHWNLKLAFSLVKTESVLQEGKAHQSPTIPRQESCVHSTRESDATDKQYAIQVTIDDSFFGLAPSLYRPEEDIPLLYLARNRGCLFCGSNNLKTMGRKRKRKERETTNDDGTAAVLRLHPDLAREDRRSVHILISKTCRDFDTKTIPKYCKVVDGDDQSRDIAAIAVKWSKRARERARKNQNGSNEASSAIASTGSSINTLCVLKKSRIEHFAAVNTLASVLRCSHSEIGLAGMKDMHAVSYQFCTIANVSVERVERERSSLSSKGIELGKFRQVDWLLNRGDLYGNRFKVTVRNVKRIHVQMVDGVCAEEYLPCEADHIRSMVARVTKSGFVNFYGEQRLGVPGRTPEVGVRGFDIGRALLQHDFSKAIDLLMSGRLVCRGHDESESPEIRHARKIWKESKGDTQKTLKAMPRVNATSKERTVLQGLKRFGSEDPCAALKCLHVSIRTFWINAYQSYVWNTMASARLKRYGTNVVKGDLYRAPGKDGREEIRVVGDDPSCVSMAEVVLPMPGYAVQYPENEIGDLYHDFLRIESVSFDRGAPLEATAKGSYRPLIAFAENLDVLLLTQQGDTITNSDTGQDTVADSMVLEFDLPSGSYATMLLRELMLTTVTR